MRGNFGSIALFFYEVYETDEGEVGMIDACNCPLRTHGLFRLDSCTEYGLVLDGLASEALALDSKKTADDIVRQRSGNKERLVENSKRLEGGFHGTLSENQQKSNAVRH